MINFFMKSNQRYGSAITLPKFHDEFFYHMTCNPLSKEGTNARLLLLQIVAHDDEYFRKLQVELRIARQKTRASTVALLQDQEVLRNVGLFVLERGSQESSNSRVTHRKPSLGFMRRNQPREVESLCSLERGPHESANKHRKPSLGFMRRNQPREEESLCGPHEIANIHRKPSLGFIRRNQVREVESLCGPHETANIHRKPSLGFMRRNQAGEGENDDEQSFRIVSKRKNLLGKKQQHILVSNEIMANCCETLRRRSSNEVKALCEARRKSCVRLEAAKASTEAASGSHDQFGSILDLMSDQNVEIQDQYFATHQRAEDENSLMTSRSSQSRFVIRPRENSRADIFLKRRQAKAIERQRLREAHKSSSADKSLCGSVDTMVSKETSCMGNKTKSICGRVVGSRPQRTQPQLQKKSANTTEIGTLISNKQASAA